MTIRTKGIEYADGGTLLEGMLAWDDAIDGPRPGILVSHAWRGRSDFEEGKARRLAELGYAGFALDLYGKGVLGRSSEENAALMQPFINDRPMLQARLRLALGAMQGQSVVDGDRCAAIGYCFGGLCVLDLARSGAAVVGVASFHGLFGAPPNTRGNRIAARVLALHGWDDPMVPPEQVVALARELSDAGSDWQIHAYGATSHAFTNPLANDAERGLVYKPEADRRAWQALVNFLDELFGDCDKVASTSN